LYSSGVFKPSQCGTTLDHAVAVTGYNFDASTPYYIVRNSWGDGWGNAGYIWMEAVDDWDGTCGINMEPEYVETKTFAG